MSSKVKPSLADGVLETASHDHDTQHGGANVVWKTETASACTERTISGKLHDLEVQVFARKLFFTDQKAQIRFLDKLTFILAVFATLAITFCMSNATGRAYLPFLFSIGMPLLIVIRYFQYSKRKWQYFLLDFCYFANVALIIYLIFFPESQLFLALLFVFARGPLAWSVLMFRNSLVFHSIDKFTSCAIHMFPFAVTATLRRYPEDVAEVWFKNSNQTFETDLSAIEDSFALPMWALLPLLSLSIFCAHQLLQFFIIYILARAPFMKSFLRVQEDDEYLTLFRYTVASGTFSIVDILGPNYRLLSWYLANALFAFLTCSLGYLYWHYPLADIIFGLLVTFQAIQNGASFYLEVFACNYNAAKSIKMSIPPGKVLLDESEFQAMLAKLPPDANFNITTD